MTVSQILLFGSENLINKIPRNAGSEPGDFTVWHFNYRELFISFYANPFNMP